MSTSEPVAPTYDDLVQALRDALHGRERYRGELPSSLRGWREAARLAKHLAETDRPDRDRLLLDLVRAHVGAVLGVSSDEIPPDKPFAEMRFDCLRLIRLRLNLCQTTFLPLPSGFNVKHPTCASVATLLARLYAQRIDPPGRSYLGVGDVDAVFDDGDAGVPSAACVRGSDSESEGDSQQRRAGDASTARPDAKAEADARRLAKRIADANSRERHEILVDLVRSVFAEMTGGDPQTIPRHERFPDMRLGSPRNVELCDRLRDATLLPLPRVLFVDPEPASLATVLLHGYEEWLDLRPRRFDTLHLRDELLTCALRGDETVVPDATDDPPPDIDDLDVGALVRLACPSSSGDRSA